MFNTLRPRQNGRHFADHMFKCIFSNENVWKPIEISLKFVTKGLIYNDPALFQIMAWRRPGDKPLSELMMFSSLTHICVIRPQWVKASLLVNMSVTNLIKQMVIFSTYQQSASMLYEPKPPERCPFGLIFCCWLFMLLNKFRSKKWAKSTDNLPCCVCVLMGFRLILRIVEEQHPHSVVIKINPGF